MMSCSLFWSNHGCFKYPKIISKGKGLNRFIKNTYITDFRAFEGNQDQSLNQSININQNMQIIFPTDE